MPTAARTEDQASQKNRGVVVSSVLGVLLVSVAAGFWFTRKAATEIPVAGEVAATLHLETFVLNLADPGMRSYARVGIDLGLGRPVGRGENAPALGPVRDTIIEVIGQAKADDLTTTQGKAKLKADLLRTLQQRVPGLGVEEVYFTEFLIQR